MTSPRYHFIGITTYIVIAALLAAMLALSGCMSPPQSPARAARARTTSQDDFDAGAHRTPNAKTMFALAKILIAKGRDRDAIQLLGQTIKKFPNFRPAYNELAGLYVSFDRLNDAIEVLSAARQRVPNDPVLLNNLGLCYFLQQDYERAAGTFEQAVTLVPDSALYRANQAMALGMLGRDAEASRAYGGVVQAESIQHNLSVIQNARRIN